MQVQMKEWAHQHILSSKDDDDYVPGKFPTLSTKRKHSPQKTFPVKKARKEDTKPEPTRYSSMAQQCKDLISKDVKHWDWGYMACSSGAKVEEFIAKLRDNEKLIFIMVWGPP